MSKILQVCQQAPVIPVLVVEQLAQAGPLAGALVRGGLPVLEVTLRTPVALDAIRAMREVEGSVVGAGTVLTEKDVRAVKAAGADFIVSPGATERLLKAAQDAELPLLPGAVTGSEVMYLLEQGLDVLKLFPAEAVGGMALLKSLYGPLPQAHFCPTGGISPANAAAYLALPNVVCVGGSWVAPRALLEAGDWAGIERLARDCRQLGNEGKV
ncbi:MAG: bifunctional 4-hydroxy-2-oxoglutarate aldolase/2-dehydro-3-deoxy-phosphogluconate aldolase [Thiothrix sp.]|nr:bifunctional 4-hydroxy-2-oxoglutarate aldolase/2-dehydro-3-deoxy-phosphogluconate aldolase [Thiothrix sp.]HPE61871.1 bifunctional 4-hydroxy-2-oxoglutarate aldolase/2-dehydro-3-deoxy-phosphogluconate aldolase [Thiolinea sp.]